MTKPDRPRRSPFVPTQGGAGPWSVGRRGAVEGTSGAPSTPEVAPRDEEVRDEDAGVRILVVDDTREVRVLVGIVLSEVPLWTVVAEASNGAEAITLANETRPDLVLLDLSMPVMDGLEALPTLRRLLPDGLVVLLTAFPVADVVEVATAAGADACLDKVDMATALVPALRRLLEARSDQPAGGPARNAGRDGSSGR